MIVRHSLALGVLLALTAPASARADGFVIPFVGVNFAGNSGHDLADSIDAQRFDWGVSAAYMGAGAVGIEGDVAYSPDFFGKTDIGGSSVLTATGNLLLGIPIGGEHGAGIRPYALAGLGMVRVNVDVLGAAKPDTTKAAWDVGGGVMFFFGTHIGLRADLRYFRTVGDVDFLGPQPASLEFARGSAGAIIRF